MNFRKSLGLIDDAIITSSATISMWGVLEVGKLKQNPT